jgi:hypothetical protein
MPESVQRWQTSDGQLFGDWREAVLWERREAVKQVCEVWCGSVPEKWGAACKRQILQAALGGHINRLNHAIETLVNAPEADLGVEAELDGPRRFDP